MAPKKAAAKKKIKLFAEEGLLSIEQHLEEVLVFNEQKNDNDDTDCSNSVYN